MKKIFLLNLGCPKNQKDGEIVLASFLRNGFEYVTEPESANVILVNTCAFIDEAKSDSISNILNVAELKQKGACETLIVMGCLSQIYPDDLLHELPEVDIFTGVSMLDKVYSVYSNYIVDKSRVHVVEAPGYISNSYDYLEYLEGTSYVPETGRYSKYLKISEGCNNNCAYCSIPLIRGNLVYRDIDSVVNELRFHVSRGIKEIVLLGQDLTADKRYLKDLLRRIAGLSDIERPYWLRLMYCNPWGVDNELLDMICDYPWITNYIDMPIQHISDKILKAMGRKSGSKVILNHLEELRKRDITVRTSLLLGFPGETDKDFEILRNLVKEAYFTWLGLFVYSPQEGTRAVRLKNEVPGDIAIERRNELDRLQFDITYSFNKSCIGNTYDFLFHGKTGEGLTGRIFSQAPVVDGVVFLDNFEKTDSGIARVVIEDTNGMDLLGREI